MRFFYNICEIKRQRIKMLPRVIKAEEEEKVQQQQQPKTVAVVNGETESPPEVTVGVKQKEGVKTNGEISVMKFNKNASVKSEINSGGVGDKKIIQGETKEIVNGSAINNNNNNNVVDNGKNVSLTKDNSKSEKRTEIPVCNGKSETKDSMIVEKEKTSNATKIKSCEKSDEDDKVKSSPSSSFL